VTPPSFDADDFTTYYSFSPAALALREAVRLRAVRGLELAEPILDVGCGDGLFAQLAYPGKQIWGIDINPSEVKRAQATASYQTLICGNVCQVDLPPAFFGSAIANCSLEHVPDLPAALANIRRSLRPGATFVLIVPTPDWSRQLALAGLLERAGLASVAGAYADALDRVFKHVHLHDDDWWHARLADAGFGAASTRPIVSRATSWLFEMLLPASALGLMVKKLTGRWIAMPSLRGATASLSRNLIERIGERLPEGQDQAAEYLIIARALGPDGEPGDG
jgi:SAM-dependent methyltransferase